MTLGDGMQRGAESVREAAKAAAAGAWPRWITGLYSHGPCSNSSYIVMALYCHGPLCYSLYSYGPI